MPFPLFLSLNLKRGNGNNLHTALGPSQSQTHWPSISVTTLISAAFETGPEGLRLKHAVGQNSVKIYDKQAPCSAWKPPSIALTICAAFDPKRASLAVLELGVLFVAALPTGTAARVSPEPPTSATSRLLPLCDTSSPLGRLI
jgi:hypothetical protein